jgi:uncharacterized protein (TIGR03083 family)
MSAWNFTDFASKDNMLRTIREQSDQLVALASAPDAWEDPTASGEWQVRDVVGHIVDTTDGYLHALETVRSGGTAPAPLGLAAMHAEVDRRARAHRVTPQSELMAQLEKGRAELLSIFEGLDADAWTGLIVPHAFMGPLPACFYLAGQLVDYTVHGWDVRQGTGRGHVLDADAADLLVPFCFVVWQNTADLGGGKPFTVGVRVSGHSGGETRIGVGAEGVTLEPGPVDDLPLVLDFDPASFVLTVMGRINGGSARGDSRLAERFANLFFRI